MKKRILSHVLAVAILFTLILTVNTPAQAATEIPSSGLIIFNQDNFVVTATKINRDRNGYVTDIEFTIANNGTIEKSISLAQSIRSVIKINNFTFNEYFTATVAAGKIAREKVRLDSDDVKLLGLKDIYEITMQFETYVLEDYSKTNVKEFEPVTIKIANGSFGEFANGSLVFSNKDADVYACGFYSGYIYDRAIFVVKNKTSGNQQFNFTSLSVNSYMSGWYDESENIYKDTYGIFHVYLDEGFTKDNITNIEFTLKTSEFLSFVSYDKTEIGTVNITYKQGSAIPIEKPPVPGGIAGNYYYTDIVVYLWNTPVNAINVGGVALIDVESLIYYGFSVSWLPADRVIKIEDLKTSYISPEAANGSLLDMKGGQVGNVAGQYYFTDIITYLNGAEIICFNIGGRAFINAEAMLQYGYNVVWNSTQRTLVISRN